MAFDPLSAGLSLGTSLISGALGSSASKKAAKQAVKGQKRAIDAQNRNMLLNVGMYEPNRALGYGAMSDLANLYGYALPQYETANQLASTVTPLGAKQVGQYIKSGMSLDQIAKLGTLSSPSAKQLKKLRKAGLTGEDIQRLMTPAQQSTYQGPLQGGTGGSTGTAQPGNMSRFFVSPDYQFRRDEGIRGIEQGAAARGGALGSNALRNVTAFNSNLASGEFGNYWQRLMAMAGIGSNAQNAISNVGTNTANNNSQSYQNIGAANAAGTMGAANSWANALNSGLNNYFTGSYVNGMNGSGVTPSSLGLTDYQVNSAFNSLPRATFNGSGL